jgi:hypothetical protein
MRCAEGKPATQSQADLAVLFGLLHATPCASPGS